MDKSMKRRPHQVYYRPGSGALRKSNSAMENNELKLMVDSKQYETTNSTYVESNLKNEEYLPRSNLHNITNSLENLEQMTIIDVPRKAKKPDLEIYVPRIVAKNKNYDGGYFSFNSMSMKKDGYIEYKGITDEHDFQRLSNGNDKEVEGYNSSSSKKCRRYSNRNRVKNYKDYTEVSEAWNDKTKKNRQMKQSCEPKGINNFDRDCNNGLRMRDTRSVEPILNSDSSSNYIDEPYAVKPPSGRRHSAIGVERLNELPPRFRKKILEEGKFKHGNFQEDGWNGTSLTFQGTFAEQHNFTAIHSHHSKSNAYATLPHSDLCENPNIKQNVDYATLPGKTRGRGRLNCKNYHCGSIGQVDLRSPCNSRPSTPPCYGYFRINESSRGRSSRSNASSYNRKNECQINSGKKYTSSSRHISQERYRRNDFNENYSCENRFPQRKFANCYSEEKREDPYQRCPDQANQGVQSDHQDHKYQTDSNGEAFDTKSYTERKDCERQNKAKRDEIKNLKQTNNSGRSAISMGTPSALNHSDSKRTPIRHCEETTDESSQNLIEADLETLTDVFMPHPTISKDWSEEVELNYKLESRVLSDVPTRSSSVISLIDNNGTRMCAQANDNSGLMQKSKRSQSGTRPTNEDKTSESFSQCFYSDTFFKAPVEPENTKNKRGSSIDRFNRSSRSPSRESSFDRRRRISAFAPENWRKEIIVRQEQEKGRSITRSRKRSDNINITLDISEDTNFKGKNSSDFPDIDMKKAGVIIIQPCHESGSTPPSLDHPRCAEALRQPMEFKTKSLFDPNNPDKPIIVMPANMRVALSIPENTEIISPPVSYDQYGNICPSWYREGSEENGQSRYPGMINDVKRADQEIQYAINSGMFLKNWSAVETFRKFLREALKYFLCKDLKFSQTGNIEKHFWKLLYYNIIERIRKAALDDEGNKEHYKKFVLYLVDEGTQYFENLLKVLEETYQFDLTDYLGVNHSVPQKGLGYIGLALISAQKLFIFLGDLARYKEQINDTTSYGKCRQWYIKAHEINPKNGRPYKQLAVLAVCARRKLDAVYYFMRSLMSSNPIYSAREKLTNLFYENSKKYEQGEKKRREERLQRLRQHMKEKENDHSILPTSVRKETWIRPDGGKRVHRTTQAVLEDDSEEEILISLSSVEVNKRFVISFLHVHGKLITRIGMESFQEAAMQMLKEFRALLQHSPLPLPSNRLLQLLALNMYAIESTQFKDPQLQLLSGYRSEFQERALVVSLQMFNLILERCISLLEEHLMTQPKFLNTVSMDVHVLLPSIKIWCDWMICHSSVWNPPPSTQDFSIGARVDVWTRFALFINLLSQLNQSVAVVFSNEESEGYEQLRLPEDNVLSGFTPLMPNIDKATYIPQTYDVESAQFVLRLNKLLFFGTEFLCGLEPPVLKLEIDNGFQEYISVVSNSNSRDSPESLTNMRINDEVLIENFSEDEQKLDSLSADTSSEVRDLWNRKMELEKTHKSQERHLERVKKILSQSVINVHIEILPKYLIPDTNCFIDHLDRISNIMNTPFSPYTIVVPIVVLSELEGLSRGGKSPLPETRLCLDPDHIKRVGESALNALTFLKNRHSNLKCVTTKGAVFNSTTFTTEDDSTSSCISKNDDKILTTCLNLSKVHGKETMYQEGAPRHIFREVVLLTDDRNLRVKALSTDVPVRELPDFMKWAGIA